MKGKWISLVVLSSAAAALLNLASCGHSQELVSIQVQPTVETWGATDIPVPADAGLQVQLRALGTYVHPPVTKDITNQVTWATNTPQMVTVTSAGLATATGDSCGGTLISATAPTNADAQGLSAPGAVITGYMTADVVCYSGSGTGSGPALTVAFGGSGSGTVTSTGFSCGSPGPCSAYFPTGSVVSLTATAAGSSTFASWTGCSTAPNINPCMITLETSTTVTVSFN